MTDQEIDEEIDRLHKLAEETALRLMEHGVAVIVLIGGYDEESHAAFYGHGGAGNHFTRLGILSAEIEDYHDSRGETEEE